MSRTHTVALVVGAVLCAGSSMLNSCGGEDPISARPPQLSARVPGFWYAADSRIPPLVFALELRGNETLVHYVLNCGEPTPFITAPYVLDDSTIIVDLELDTANQSALEVYFAVSRIGAHQVRVVRADSQLVVKESGKRRLFDVSTYSREIPSLPGARITGELSVAGSAGNALLRVLATAVDSGMAFTGAAFLNEPGPYCVGGLPPATYRVSARYFTTRDAYLLATLPIDSLDAMGFLDSVPFAQHPSLVDLTGENSADNVDLTLNKSAVIAKRHGTAKSKRSSAGDSDWRRLLAVW